MKKSEKQRKVWDVAVVGGGPAGMMAAGRAAERGLSVLLLEKNPAPGKKLLMTGGGRCNVTNNTPDVRTMLSRYRGNGKYLFSAFTQFGVEETVEFFRSHGMRMKEEAEGRMFPSTEKAQTVWDVFARYMKSGGVVLETNAAVTDIIKELESDEFIITYGQSGKKEARARSVVVATGGTSRPDTGSTGEGFRWLARFGHVIHKPDVALVPIALSDRWVRSAAGVSLQNIRLTTYQNGEKQKIYKGKILFTHVGISGPTVLNMSREVGELLGSEGSEYERKRPHEVMIHLDLFPGSDHAVMKEKIQTLLQRESNKKIKNVLSELVPSALVLPVLQIASIDADTPCHSVRTEERKALVSLLRAIPLHVKGLLGKDKAVVSSGGVSLPEVDFKTMGSRLVPGLFLAGDVLNIDRPSGGYSLQVCWTTGYIAGSNC
jgi:predicted Rossmann fold flavoprotein